ncbi:hypothetical protein CRM22_002882 [Opisthorchis felineus]|uniref:Uncharacterized protein n=1 Tax=Opisthorchis felineus TaxID=147828 RepID=A0A4S2M8F2_OPIFE|nr:hypothetical protein CRM22_002882 [Opisthorchis felineus]
MDQIFIDAYPLLFECEGRVEVGDQDYIRFISLSFLPHSIVQASTSDQTFSPSPQIVRNHGHLLKLTSTLQLLPLSTQLSCRGSAEPCSESLNLWFLPPTTQFQPHYQVVKTYGVSTSCSTPEPLLLGLAFFPLTFVLKHLTCISTSPLALSCEYPLLIHAQFFCPEAVCSTRCVR